MKSKPIFAIIFLVAFIELIISCKTRQNHANPSTVKITSADNGKTIALSSGGSLALTLGNPGDGGYSLDTPQYDKSVLSLKSHTHQAPKSSAVAGDFGTDLWQFKALKSGTTKLTVTATRPFDQKSTVAIFTGTISVNQ
jgi:predicted secreted protein